MAPKPTYKELEQRIKGLKKEADKRGQAENALRKSEQEKTAILESISEIVIYVDTDMRVIWANNVLLKAFNLSRDQIEGKFCYQVLHNRNKPCRVCPSMKVMESGKAEETDVVSSYGKKWILRGYPVRDKVNGIIGAVEVATDVTAIKQAEEVQRQSEEKYRAIFESTGTAMIIAEEDTTVSLANAEFEGLFGYSRNEVEGKKSWTEFVSKADLERMTEYHKLRRVDSSSAPRNYEFKFVDRQGNTRDIYATVAVIPGTKKSTASFIDITERNRMEDVLRESERRLADIINFLPDATFAIDLEGKVITWNRAIEEMTGVRAKDMVGKGEHEYAMPFYGARRPILIDLVLMPEEEVEKKYSIISRKGDCLVAEPNVPTVVRGKELFLWGKASPIHDSDGNRIGGIESIRDITDHKKMEEVLRESEEKYRSLTETAADAIFTLDTEGKFTYLNPEFESVTGYAVGDFIGRSFIDVLVPEYIESTVERFKRGLSGKTTDFYEVEIKHKDGGKIPLELNVTTLLDHEGASKGRIGIARDITERKQAETEKKKLEFQLQQARKMEALGTLAGGVAHDLNNVLGGIVSYPELLLMQLPEDSPLREPISTIQKSGEKAAAIIQDMLTLARRGGDGKKR